MSVSDREQVRRSVRSAIQGTRGIGDKLAYQATERVMKTLDTIVAQATVEPPEDAPDRDDEGIKLMKRPPWVDSDWKYLMWRPANSFNTGMMWVTNCKPVMNVSRNAENWMKNPSKPEAHEVPLEPTNYKELWNSLPSVPLEQRIYRFYD